MNMSGMDNNLFVPLGTTTRAQAAVVIYNLLNYYDSKLAENEELEQMPGMRNSNDNRISAFHVPLPNMAP